MHVAMILGSPRKQGNTATILDAVKQELTKMGHSSERIDVIDFEVNGCLGCNACRTLEERPGCVQKDDAIQLFKKLIASDAVVYGTSLYTYGFPAQMKALIDRQYCLVTGYGTPEFHSWLKGKPSLLMVCFGGPEENNADLIQQVFQREGEFQEWDVRESIIVPACGAPEELGDRVADTARRVVKSLLGSIS